MSALNLAILVDSMRFQCRIRDLAFFEPSSAGDRISRIAASLERLGSGRFIIGLGPNCQEVIRIGRHPVRFGRSASPLEEHREEVIDIAVNDAALHGPREVSRLHCSFDTTDCADDQVRLIDEGSSTGTWIHPSGDRVEAGTPMLLESGTLFSLGPSGANMFLFTCA